MPTNLKRHNETGHIHFLTTSTNNGLQFFHDDAIKQIVVDGLQTLREKHRIKLIGYVVMPEHVHVLRLPHISGETEPVPISKLLNSFKQLVGYYTKAHLRTIWRQHGKLWSDPLNDWAYGKLESQHIWKTRGYDRNIYSEQELIEKLDYCHKNPVTRGLVDTPDEWIWSSYRFYEYGSTLPIGMDWDGGWPLTW